jgi:hypothetical protein
MFDYDYDDVLLLPKSVSNNIPVVAMQVAYYSKRRLNPYQGLIMVVDAGAIRAYSSHGHQWRVQASEHRELNWDRQGRQALPTRQQMARAIRQRPATPFPRGDNYELWLLDIEQGMPLALLDSAHHEAETEQSGEPQWHGFIRESSRFQSSHQDLTYTAYQLHNLINRASRPYPITQWFWRRPDGSGIGLHGLRVENDLQGRTLAATCFPEMLIREIWPESQQCDLSRAYHNWLAGYLLAHEDLSPVTRQRLEQSLLLNPVPFLYGYPQLPRVLDRQACRAAYVAARLAG